jgi:hypothetical protein
VVSSRPCSKSDVSGRRATPPSLDAFGLEFDYPIRTLRRLGVPDDDVEELAHEVLLVAPSSGFRWHGAPSLRKELGAAAISLFREVLLRKARKP